MVGRDEEWRNAENLRSGQSVNVVAAAEGFDQQRVPGEVRQQAQLDLRVIGSHQHMARFSDESCANLAAQFGADGNVLQVGIGRGQAACRRSRLIVRGVQTA